MLPISVLKKIKKELLDWQDGMSIMEISHRSQKFQELIGKVEQDLRQLLNISKNYRILFFQGGARSQFSMIPMNLLGNNKLANYVITGLWSRLAFEDACQYGNIELAATNESDDYLKIPPSSTWKVSKDANYLHYVDNETINGVEFHYTPNAPVPLVADMTSSMLSKPLDISRYVLVYASTQKNLGIAGLTIVIVHKDFLKSGLIDTPILYDYNVAIMHNSMLNTPSTFALYVTSLMLEWLMQEGGIEFMAKRNTEKSKKFYDYLDNSKLYENKVEPQSRSRINIPFKLTNQKLESKFLQQAEYRGLMQLQGHKTTGGIRASFCNAMPMEGVNALVEFMQEFEDQSSSS